MTAPSPITDTPLPDDVYDETEKFIREGEVLLLRLRTYEMIGCKLAGSQAKKMRGLIEDVGKKVVDMTSMNLTERTRK